MNLEYSVVYAARKTLTITVERDRSVVVRAPHGTPRERIDAIVERKKLWLYEKTPLSSSVASLSSATGQVRSY